MTLFRKQFADGSELGVILPRIHFHRFAATAARGSEESNEAFARPLLHDRLNLNAEMRARNQVNVLRCHAPCLAQASGATKP